MDCGFLSSAWSVCSRTLQENNLKKPFLIMKMSKRLTNTYVDEVRSDWLIFLVIEIRSFLLTLMTNLILIFKIKQADLSAQKNAPLINLTVLT